MTTYFITGGAGFIGSTLVDYLLKQGHKIVVIDNFCNFYNPDLKEKNIAIFQGQANFKLYRGDIRNLELINQIFSENPIDIVVHLAAMAGVRPSIENPILYQEVNGLGTQNLLEAAKNHNVKKLILASSSSVYGDCKETPFREDMLVDRAISPYAATKKANEVMAHVYHHLYDMSIIILRFFTVYGPKQRPDLAINKFTRKILNDEEIEMFGDGTTARDYTYVDDIIDGIARACDYVFKNHVYEIINLGNSHPIRLKDMINAIAKTLGKAPRIKQLPMQPGDVDFTFADITKAKNMLRYSPETSFEEGIKKFIDWYQEEHS